MMLIVEWGRRAVARAYAKGASTYAERFADELVTKNADRAVVAQFVRGLPVGSRVLDGGCGPGQIAAFAFERGFSAFGLDITMEMLSVAQHRLPKATLVCGDLGRLPFAEYSFQGVACWFSIHNLPRTLLPLLLAEVQQVLAPSGRLLLATHEGTGDETFQDDHGDHFVFTYYERDELAGLVSAAGFTSVTTSIRAPLDGEHQVPKLFVSAIVSHEQTPETTET